MRTPTSEDRGRNVNTMLHFLRGKGRWCLGGAKALARPLLARLPATVRGGMRSLCDRATGPALPYVVETGHSVISESDVTPDLVAGWKDPAIASRQRRLVEDELARMYEGASITVYEVAAEAVRSTGMAGASIVEVGCASGYYREVLAHLLRQRIRYIGVDYSPALVAQARRLHPHLPLVIGDAANLPLADNSCDILLSGGVLLHVPEYERAIKETARVTRHWCIFHRTPVLRTTPTTFLSKQAYGVRVVESLFNEEELLSLFAAYGMTLRNELTIGRHRIEAIGEEYVFKTYVCRKSREPLFLSAN